MVIHLTKLIPATLRGLVECGATESEIVEAMQGEFHEFWAEHVAPHSIFPSLDSSKIALVDKAIALRVGQILAEKPTNP